MEDAEHRPLGLCTRMELGPFTLEACPTSHDAAEPLAIVARGSGGASVGVAYDLGRPTTAVRYLLRNLTAIVLEANHDEVQLRTSEYPPVVQRRIAGSAGHLSNRAAADLLVELHHPGLGAVVLAHLSQHCNTAAEARATVAPALRRVGFRGALHVADQDRPLAPILVVQKAGCSWDLRYSRRATKNGLSLTAERSSCQPPLFSLSDSGSRFRRRWMTCPRAGPG